MDDEYDDKNLETFGALGGEDDDDDEDETLQSDPLAQLGE